MAITRTLIERVEQALNEKLGMYILCLENVDEDDRFAFESYGRFRNGETPSSELIAAWSNYVGAIDVVQAIGYEIYINGDCKHELY